MTERCVRCEEVQKEGQSLPERVRGSFPGTETSDLYLKNLVKAFQGNKCLAQRKKLCYSMFKEQQQILCGYTKGMVEFAAGKREGLAREGTYMQGLLLRPHPPHPLYHSFSWRWWEILQSFKQKNPQSNLYFRKVTQTAIGGVWVHSTMQKQRGHIETICKITMIKFMINADINVDTCVSFFLHLTPLWVLYTISSEFRDWNGRWGKASLEEAGRNWETTKAGIGGAS